MIDYSPIPMTEREEREWKRLEEEIEKRIKKAEFESVRVIYKAGRYWLGITPEGYLKMSTGGWE